MNENMSPNIEYKKYKDRPYLILYRDTDISDTDTCPFCGSNHSHGSLDGHRVAHCATGSKEKIVAEDGTELFQNDGYYVKTRLK